MARKSMSKKLRFEVFKRDGFKCQYCGCSSPDVILHVDHIDPVSKGGEDDIMNLVTACVDCNLGKSDRTLDDNSVLEKQRKQLQELNERREQLEMMMSWREGLKSFDEEVVETIVSYLNDLMVGRSVNEQGKKTIKTWLRKFSTNEILDSADKSALKHLNENEDESDAANFFSAIPKIAAFSRQPESDQKILYARGILRNRISYLNEKLALVLMKDAFNAGMDLDEITDIAKNVSSWSAFKKLMEDFING